MAKKAIVVWQSCIVKYWLAIWRYFITKCTRLILATSYCSNRNKRVSSFYWTRGSKLCFSHVSLILVTTFLFSIFVKSLLTNFFAPFLAARESDFLSHFLVPLKLWAGMSYMHPHISGTERVVFSKQDAHGNLVVDWLPVIFPLSAFCWRFLMQMSVGQTRIIPFLLTKILEVTLSRMT